MNKKNILMVSLVLIILLISGCSSKGKDALKFKEDYESINGKENASGKVHRSLNISKNNPFEYATGEDIVSKIENKETFYVYFGDKLCPWCRSVIEKFIEVANDYDIKTVYYVPIWDDEGTEILRDKYIVNEKGKLELSIKADETYYKLLDYFQDFLNDYTLTDSDGNILDTGEKRIYAPNFIYVKDGEIVALTEGISDAQTDSREELTSEILKDEETLFIEFFEKK